MHFWQLIAWFPPSPPNQLSANAKDLIGHVGHGLGEKEKKITSVYMLYVLSPSQRKENWLWLYLIKEFITTVSAPKLCEDWKFSSVEQCGDVSRLRCTEHKWEVVWVGCTDSKTRNPRSSPPPAAVWFALYLCGCTSLSITHESIPYSEWEELKHSLHLRHCDVSEAFMQMFKCEHRIGLQSMISALLTVTSSESPFWGLTRSVL